MKKKIIFIFLFLFVIFVLSNVIGFFDVEFKFLNKQKEEKEYYINQNIYKNEEFGFEFIYHSEERLNEESLKNNKVEFDFGELNAYSNTVLNTIEYWKSDYNNYEEMKKNIKEEYLERMSRDSYPPFGEREIIIDGKKAYRVSGVDNELKEKNHVAPEKVYTFVLNEGNLFKFSSGYACRGCFFSEEVMINEFFRFID